MPLIGAIVVLIQFCFAYHALKTGRPYWWIFIIMAFPVMGCVIYYFVEVFPGSREHRRVLRWVRDVITHSHCHVPSSHSGRSATRWTR